MLLIHEEDKNRIVQTLDAMRAAVLQMSPMCFEEVRAAHTVTAGVSDALAVLVHLKPADEHLREIVDTIFAGGRCPLGDDDR